MGPRGRGWELGAVRATQGLGLSLQRSLQDRAGGWGRCSGRPGLLPAGTASLDLRFLLRQPPLALLPGEMGLCDSISTKERPPFLHPSPHRPPTGPSHHAAAKDRRAEVVCTTSRSVLKRKHVATPPPSPPGWNERLVTASWDLWWPLGCHNITRGAWATGKPMEQPDHHGLY